MGGGKGGSKGSSQPMYIQSPPQTTTTVQQANSSPWSGQQDYLTDIFGKAQTQYADPMQFYAGSVPDVPAGQTYAPLSSDTTQAMQMVRDKALGGDTVTPAAENYTTSMLSGDFLGAGNPYFSNMVNTIYNTVTPQVESQFEKAGRYGSGSMDKSLASAMTDTAGNLAYQNYGDTMKQMGQANYVAPQISALGYTPAQQLAQVGGMTEDQTQNAINQAMSNWQFSQMEPWQRLGLYSGSVAGNYGGSSTSTGTGTGTSGQWIQPSYSNSSGNTGSLLSGLGGLGMLAYSMFSDVRTKDDIEPVSDALRLIDLLNPVTFDYKPEYGMPGQVGFVADEIEELIPGMVFTGIDGMKKLFPFAVVPLLVKAVQELREEVRQLRGSEKTLLTSTEE